MTGEPLSIRKKICILCRWNNDAVSGSGRPRVLPGDCKHLYALGIGMVIQGTRRAETERIRWTSLIAGLPVAGGGLRLKKAGESFILVVMMGK